MMWRIVGRVLVLRETREAPTDAEWEAFLAALKGYRKQVDELRLVIVTDGGGPNSTQRLGLKDALAGGKTFRSAVISDSIKIRFMASALMLIVRNHASFTSKEVERAYDHLSLTPEERRTVDETLSELERELGQSSAPRPDSN